MIRNTIFVFVSVLSGLHMTATALYFSPDNPLISDYQKIVVSYIETFFTQDWRFFVTVNNTYPGITIKCGKEKEWIDPVVRDLNMHYKTRALHYGKKIYLHRQIQRDLTEDILKSNKDCINSKSDCLFDLHLPTKKKSFLTAKKYATNECLKRFKSINIDEIKIGILQRRLKNFSNRKEKYLIEKQEQVVLYE